MCLEDEIDTLKEETVSEGSLILESESEFVAEKSKGSCDVSFEINLDEYPDRDFVVYEYLYSKNEPDKLITYHEDVNDIDQSVHVNPLYEAMFTLYKVSNVSKDIRLSGAYFDVRSTRTKRDGTVVECDLGRYVTGGIYYEDTTPFTLFVYLDEEMTQLVDSYMSGYNERFGMETVSVLDLEDGTYYAKTDISGSKIKQWQIEKGSIYLGYQLEDTKIIFRELIAPVGYHLDTSEYIVDIGHDTSTTRVENYRINALIVPPFVVPKTGIQ